MKQIKFTSYDNCKVNANVWDDVKRPKGVMVLVHDLKETLSFYNNFAEFFNKQGYIVCATTLRLHGKNENVCDDESTENDYFKQNVNDQYILTKIMLDSFNLPIIMVGVGFGAYLVKRYLEICDFANVAILIGTGYSQSLLLKTAKPIGFALHAFSRKHNFAKQIERLMFAPLELKVPNKNYITTNNELFEKIVKTENYTNLLPVNYYYSFLTNVATRDKNLNNIHKKTKILLLSGALDPVSNKSANTKKLFVELENAGLNPTMQVLENMLHNVILETDDLIVFNEILQFINTNS